VNQPGPVLGERSLFFQPRRDVLMIGRHRLISPAAQALGTSPQRLGRGTQYLRPHPRAAAPGVAGALITGR
jgi:hypothetical protein